MIPNTKSEIFTIILSGLVGAITGCIVSLVYQITHYGKINWKLAIACSIGFFIGWVGVGLLLRR